MQEIMYLKRKQERIDDAAKRPCLGGQVLQVPAASDPVEHIIANSFYVIDHSKLNDNYPDQIRSIRVVMVNEKSSLSVSLRYPSIYSLRAHIDEREENTKVPALDEKYVMRSEIAAEALYRRILPHEIDVQGNSWHFWAVTSVASQKLLPGPSSSSNSASNVISSKGQLWWKMKDVGMFTWGHRRHVRFWSRTEDDRSNKLIASYDDHDGEKKRNEIIGEKEEEGEEDVDEEKSLGQKKNWKRNTGRSACKTQKKRAKRENAKQIVVYNLYKKNKIIKNSINRWSAERYKLAETNMVKIMREQGAVIGKPILRPKLRAEARKLIGDTGLLDHLLKHMAGKVAPGSEERFRRRHNADGAMEYWLENANLVDIRKEAGVDDTYWTPPSGWKPGDHPTQDPVCARELRLLKDDMAALRRRLDELTAKRLEEEQAIVTTPISSITSQSSTDYDSLLISLKEIYVDLVNKKLKIEEKLTEVTQSLDEIKKEIWRLTAKAEDLNRRASVERTCVPTRLESASSAGDETENEKQQSTATPAPESKAAKIERLKSGFRICKPQGTFLWPNMAVSSSSPQVVVQLEDLFSVPTPPSVSSTSTLTHHHRPPSPVKPLAERRPVTVTLSAAFGPLRSDTTSSGMGDDCCLINLNELPSNQDENMFCGSLSHGPNCTYPVTYHRRHHHTVISTSLQQLSPSKNDTTHWDGDNQRKEIISYW